MTFRAPLAESVGPVVVVIPPAELVSDRSHEPSTDAAAPPVASSSSQVDTASETTSTVRPVSPLVPSARPTKVEKKRDNVDRVAFAALLQRCSSGSNEDALEAVGQLKELARGESGLARVCTLAKEWLAECHTDFVKRVHAEGAPLLEAELYARWLAECQSRVTVMHGLVLVHAPGMRDPVRGTGRVAFGVASALFHFRREGGLFDVSWEAAQSMVRPATPAGEAAIAAAADRIRDTLVRYDAALRAVVMRYKSEQNAGAGATMRACEKRMSAALAKMALRAGVNEHGEYASWMRSSRQALLQWAESATMKVT
ncbi:hypothetical protein FOMPIDRAFT_1056126 [Fomitopsis schrenkii]|uniref:Uncharacterized protein n=1 Tax=Fomitopsis schrenkii TaxID=2126942 RepID=S8DKJ5_FOMSC|nr:hypothetical protein FOMPIDRAFT_1056126 [Fomitopsis schrenkii]